MIPPIDIQCPMCQAAPGSHCRSLHAGHHQHHAERIDAAARRWTGATSPPVEELSDAEIEDTSDAVLRLAYTALRDHHIAETTALSTRVKHMQKVYDAVLEWRKHVTLSPTNPRTARMLDAIDEAVKAKP